MSSVEMNTQSQFDEVRDSDGDNGDSTTVSEGEFDTALRAEFGDTAIDSLGPNTVKTLFQNADQSGDQQLDATEFKSGMNAASEQIGSGSESASYDSVSPAAQRFLTGDKDGKVDQASVDSMIERGFLEVKDGELKTTEKGDEVLGYADDSYYGLGGKQIEEHIFDYEADQNGVTQGNMAELAEQDMYDFGGIDDIAQDFLDALENPPKKYELNSMIQMGFMEVNDDGELELTDKGKELAAQNDSKEQGPMSLAESVFEFQKGRQ